ncbi:MAG: L-histidine N(alpha)-methyltransferase [Fuerstiella sp.]|nr:L-histidine N(alpha)-methyltransferase [Fuerstiella sp.]MCP4854928.1 L-histidine N(alpha)-methyltransferase [Fuerstiella sp.]
MSNSSTIFVANKTQDDCRFLSDVVAGLRQKRRTLPCRYFYDHRGSQLFDQICQLDEYYPTRTELAIMQLCAPEMGEQIGPGAMLIEFGSGSSTKTRLLLDHLIDPIAYVPVDVSREHLYDTAAGLAEMYPQIDVLPVCADFTRDFDLPAAGRRETHDAVYFPGSTIGNFEPPEVTRLLQQIVSLCGTGGGLLIGIDLQKNVDIVTAAYNDSQAVTAQFNLNILHRMNRELGANFNVENFGHVAIYNQALGRIEMYLESLCHQSVNLGEHDFSFAAGERICTEYSHKYTIDGFAAIAERVGLTLRRQWLDDNKYFAVLHFALLD